MKSFMLFALLFTAVTTRAELLLAEKGEAKCVVLVDPAATAPEQNAAKELAATLHEITGANFFVRTNIEAPENAILVGSGTTARRVFAEVPFDGLSAEELVIKTKGSHLLWAADVRGARSTP